LIVAVLAAAAVSTAAAAVSVHWNVLAQGATEESSARHASGYIAITKAQEARFASRLSDNDRAAIAKVDLKKTGLVAVFLDGIPCAHDVKVTNVTRSAATVTVILHWTRPPVGMGMCVNLGAPYAVIGVTRATLGHPAPQHVRIVAFARS
jgi:hypothetical protein